MTPLPTLARALADAFLAGAWERRRLLERGALVLAARPQWLGQLVLQVRRAFPEPPRGADDALAEWILDTLKKQFRRQLIEGQARVRRWRFPRLAMGPARWPVRPIVTEGELATWLGLTPAELAWFADVPRHRTPRSEALRHYVFRWVPKRVTGWRLLAAPKDRLKAIQRALHRSILAHAPPHDAAQGFREGRSAISHAALHAGARVVIHFDLADFFGSIGAGRVRAIFRSLGYRRGVAELLTGLCTTAATPEAIAACPDPRTIVAARLRVPSLPQGAPTSPALANLAAFGLDVRLSALAAKFGATYSRYADDLTFSGPATLARRTDAVLRLVGVIVAGEGFELRRRKTRVQASGQRQVITGIVVNAHPNVPRDAFDGLKATLHNCALHGPSTQNHARHPQFRAHLEGRVAWVAAVNPRRGAKLRALFERIDWTR